jgi:predicted PurR-regulated permease PerM
VKVRADRSRDAEEESMKAESNPNTVSGQPLPESRRPADKTKRVVHIDVSSAAAIRLVLVAACLWLLIKLWPVFLVLVGALLVVGTMSPAVSWMEARRVKRGLAIAIVFLLLCVAAALVVTLTVPTFVEQASALVEQEPAFRARLANYLDRSNLTAPLAGWLRHFKYDVSASAVSATVFAFSVRVFEITAYGLSAIFLALYMMIDRDRLRGWLFAAVPRSHHIRLARVMMNLETIVGAYIRGQVITCLLIAVFSFGLLTACGVPHALALAVFAGVADVLPYVGAILSIGPMVLAALARGPVIVAVVLLVMLAYEEFESRVLVPRIYGRALRLPSSVVLFALLAGGTLMGLPGALLALPVAATVMMLINELRVELPVSRNRSLVWNSASGTSARRTSTSAGQRACLRSRPLRSPWKCRTVEKRKKPATVRPRMGPFLIRSVAERPMTCMARDDHMRIEHSLVIVPAHLSCFTITIFFLLVLLAAGFRDASAQTVEQSETGPAATDGNPVSSSSNTVQNPSSTPSAEESKTGAAPQPEAKTGTPETEGPDINPCANIEVSGETWLDQVHDYTERSICRPAVWFDHFLETTVFWRMSGPARSSS